MVKKFSDLPIGTIVINKNSLGDGVEYLINSDRTISMIENNGDTKNIGNRDYWHVTSQDVIKYPEQYNSPLWKVLNGEDV